MRLKFIVVDTCGKLGSLVKLLPPFFMSCSFEVMHHYFAVTLLAKALFRALIKA